jgi:hypothetical protein
MDLAFGPGLFDPPIELVHQEEVAIRVAAERFAFGTLAPFAPVEGPEADHVGVGIGTVHERLDVLLHELGGRIRV